MKAVVYGVKSSPDEKESVADQHRLILEAIQDDKKEIIGPFGEASASGYRAERGPQLEAAMRAAIAAAAQDGEAELWVWHSSRLARGDGTKGRRSIQLIVAQLLYENVTVRSVADPEMVTPMLAGIASTVSHKYAQDLSDHTKRGLAQRKAAGKPVGPLPYGYASEFLMQDGRNVLNAKGKPVKVRVIDPAAASEVDAMHRKVAAGATPGDVARNLNERGIRTQRGNTWRARAVQQLIDNDTYIGSNGYPPIVTSQLARDARNALRRLDPAALQRRRGGRTPDPAYLLRGIAFCKCGAPLYCTTKYHAGRRGYVCRDKVQSSGLCDRPAVPAELAEQHVLEHLNVFVDQLDDWLAERTAERNTEQQQHRAHVEAEQAELDRLDAARDRHLDEYRRMVEVGDPLARLALEAIDRLDADRERQQQAVREAQAVAAEWTAPPDLDQALDVYNAIRELIADRVRDAVSPADLNAALASALDGLWIESDRGRLLIEFALTGAASTLLPDGTPAPGRLWLPPASSKPHSSRTSTAGFGIPPLVVVAR